MKPNFSDLNPIELRVLEGLLEGPIPCVDISGPMVNQEDFMPRFVESALQGLYTKGLVQRTAGNMWALTTDGVSAAEASPRIASPTE